jgi:hypothetical protein
VNYWKLNQRERDCVFKLLKDAPKQLVLVMFSAILKKEFHQFSFVFKMKLFVSRQLKALSKQVVSARL